MKWRFNFVLRKSCSKWDRWDDASSWANIQSSSLTTYSIAGNNSLRKYRQQFSLLTVLPLLLTKKRFDNTIPWNRSGYHDFSGRFVCWTKEIFIRDIWFLSFTIYTIILQIGRNFKSEIFFIFPNRFFVHADVTFKSFS